MMRLMIFNKKVCLFFYLMIIIGSVFIVSSNFKIDKIYLGLGTTSRGIYVFENREVTRQYLKIVDGSPIKSYITKEGKRIVWLIYYFRDYYKNLSP